MLQGLVTIPRTEVTDDAFHGYPVVEWVAIAGSNLYTRVWLVIGHGSLRRFRNDTRWDVEDTRVTS